MESHAIAGAQVVARVAQLLKLVGERSAAGRPIAELVSMSGLTRPTVYRLLAALEATGLIEQDKESRLWHLGPEAYVLGTLAANRFNIERMANTALIRIADQTGESAFLSIPRGMECVCLHREEGTYPIRTHVLQAGDRLPLGVGSAGLAILAAMPDQKVEEAIKANRDQIKQRFPNYTPKLLHQLVAETRKAGYSVNKGLILPGSWGIAAAVLDSEGDPMATLSITGIETRLQEPRQSELGQLLVEEARRLATEIPSASRAQMTADLAAPKNGH
jgi:DNA-binding IclR family transcriptional regulator